MKNTQKIKTILTKEGYLLKKENFKSKDLDIIKKELTVEPQISYSVGIKSKIEKFSVYKENDEYLSIPKFYGLNKFGKPEKNDEIICGGVYQPLTDEFYWAVKGKGAFCNNLRLRVSKKENLNQCMLGTGIPHRGMQGHESYLPGLEKLMSNVAGVRRMGAASLDLVYTASGKFDGYWEKNLKLVDIAAGSIIVKEAGGRVTDFKGRNNYLESGEIVASNFVIHDKLLSEI